MRHLNLSMIGAAAVALAPAAALAQAGGTPAAPAGAAGRSPPAATAQPATKTFGDWEEAKPGARWLIRPADLPKPGATQSASNPPGVTQRRGEAQPLVPEGFKVSLFASGLKGPRKLAVAPNGDVFVAESEGGQIHVFKMGGEDGKPAQDAVFASGLNAPYGIAFYPATAPKYVYIAETNRVIRFAYTPGDMKAAGKAEVIVPDLPTGGHWTRDIAFSLDGEKMYIAVGSASNVAENMPKSSPPAAAPPQPGQVVGTLPGEEKNRADVLVASPDGKGLKPYATGIRNCAGLTVEPGTGAPWCATNERDGLGDNLPPDYVTRVQEGGFYGWPWYYIGPNEDPRHKGERPDLAKYVVTPDVLIQPHSAPLGIAFYTGKLFPEEYQGDAFVTLHGSWNRDRRTGYKVVRVRMENGQPTGEYDDFMTGFVVSAKDVWGRPVGVAVAGDGSLLVSEDGSNTIWRVTH